MVDDSEVYVEARTMVQYTGPSKTPLRSTRGTDLESDRVFEEPAELRALEFDEK